jgi:hypothetical protein
MTKDMAKQARQAKADRNDLFTAMIVGALAIGVLVYDAVRRLVELFSTAGAVTVTAPVPAQTITAAIGDGAPGTTDMATLVVEGVNTVSVVSLVLAIALRAVCLIAVAVLAVIVCQRLLSGVVFDQLNTRLTFATSIGLLAAGLIGPWFESMGLNGAFAALGGDFGDDRWLLLRDGIPLFVAAIAVGVLVIVFRRGARLQKETEGLV